MVVNVSTLIKMFLPIHLIIVEVETEDGLTEIREDETADNSL